MKDRLFTLFLLAALAMPGLTSAADAAHAIATFAGGCFWCMEPPYDELDGVVSTTSGYIGGHSKNPTYEEVSAGAPAIPRRSRSCTTGPRSATEGCWKCSGATSTPTARNGQFCDDGTQYRCAIFYHDAAQRRLADQSRGAEATGRFPAPIVTEIVAAGVFDPAEAYHQDYYLKNPLRYRFYRYQCGRDQRLEELWGKQ